MFRNILVAVDGSPTSNRGLRAALKLAKDQKAALHVVHVVDQSLIALGLGGAYYATPDYVDSIVSGLQQVGTRVLRKAEAAAARQGQKVQTALVDGLGPSVAHSILRYARKAHADVIVMGTHGRGGLSRFIMGSDAEAVLRESRVPVLLVHGEARKRSATSDRRPAATGARRDGEGVRPSP